MNKINLQVIKEFQSCVPILVSDIKEDEDGYYFYAYKGSKIFSITISDRIDNNGLFSASICQAYFSSPKTVIFSGYISSQTFCQLLNEALQ